MCIYIYVYIYDHIYIYAQLLAGRIPQKKYYFVDGQLMDANKSAI